jgi:hypothetical protein
MKKITYLIIAICFTGFTAKSQYSCTSPRKIDSQFTIYDSIPPAGTIGAVGPDYGCLTVTGRQLWFYVPVCNTNYLYQLDLSYSNSAGLDTVGTILYGPFSQAVTNCADFNSSKILTCSQMQNNNGNINISLLDTLYAGNYYYLLLTYSDAIGQSSMFYFFPSAFYSLDCFECNNQVSVIDKNNICMVTVDTAINKCVLTWEEFPDVNLAGYNIYRESSLTGIYDSIATVPVGSASTYTDMASSPSQHNYTYGVRGIDSCGNTYAQSNLTFFQPFVSLTSIHLISFAGGNNQANLIWNNVYTNNNFIPQYFIYRNNNGSGWQVIDSIGITLSTITYTDIFAPPGSNQYTVELRKLVPCVPMRTTSTPYESVFSNTTTTIVTGIENLSDHSFFQISPNPATSTIQLTFNAKLNGTVECEIWSVMGERVWASPLTPLQRRGESYATLDVSFLENGIYFIKINADGKSMVQKVVKM